MREVLYLSKDSKEKGLVFVDELPENYYSPGAWYLYSETRSLDESYSFIARDGEEIVKTTLVKIRGNFFRVKHKDYGSFPFEAIPVDYRYNEYIGTIEKYKQGKFFKLHPLNENKLEFYCLSSIFYFIGSSDEFDNEVL